MILVICTSPACGAQYRCIGGPREIETLVGKYSEFYPDKYRCPSCMSPAQFAYEAYVNPSTLTKLRDLEAQELFRGMHGLGLPEEQICDAETVTKLLTEQKVKRVVGQQIRATARFNLEYIEFESGHRMYFGASTHGALIYRITEPMNHTDKALEELGANDGA